MSRAGAIGLLAIVLAACALSLIVAPGHDGLVASSVMLACWFALTVAAYLLSRRVREHV